MRLDNLLYDMDVSTASSSSDSETPANTPQRAVLEEAPVDSMKKEPSALGQTYNSMKEEQPSALEKTHKSAPAKSSASLVKPPSVVSPSTNRKPVSSSRMRRASSTADSKKPKRPSQIAPRDSSGSHKRWV